MISADLPAAQRGRLAARLVPVALDLACLVRQDGDPEAIGSLLGSLNAAERDALPVILAAMIPLDQSPQDLLSWVGWDEHGRPLPPDAVMVIDTAEPPRWSAARDAECGTPWGYDRHRRHWEAICDPCRDAYNAYVRDRRRKRNESAA